MAASICHFTGKDVRDFVYERCNKKEGYWICRVCQKHICQVNALDTAKHKGYSNLTRHAMTHEDFETEMKKPRKFT